MKGLLAPQNTFLDTIATRFDGTRKFAFNYSDKPSSISSQSLGLPWHFMWEIRHCIVWCSQEKKKKLKKKVLSESCLFLLKRTLTLKCLCFQFIRKRMARKWHHLTIIIFIIVVISWRMSPAAVRGAESCLQHRGQRTQGAHLNNLSVSCVVCHQLARLERTFNQAEAETAIKISTTTSVSALFSFPNEQSVSPLRSRISELRLLWRICA